MDEQEARLRAWSDLNGRTLHVVASKIGRGGHSIATLAKHYSGVIRELEDVPRVPVMDDAGLEPATSALSRRKRVAKT